VCCSVLQCVAVCCSVLQCVAVCCNETCTSASYVRIQPTKTTHCAAVRCSVLQYVAVFVYVLQCVAVRHIPRRRM